MIFYTKDIQKKPVENYFGFKFSEKDNGEVYVYPGYKRWLNIKQTQTCFSNY